MKRAPSILLCLLALFGWVDAACAAKVVGIRSFRAPEYTRLVFDLDSPIEHSLTAQQDPERLIIDLRNSELPGDFNSLRLDNTPIAAISSSTREGGDLRVVLDLRAKVDPRSFTLTKNEQYGDRLVIDLYDIAGSVTTVTPTANTGDPIAAITSSLPNNDSKRDIVVAISAGHGGDDPGAIGVNRLQEKQVTLAISREIAALLNSTPGYKAVLIRDGDYYVGLRDRVRKTHEYSADLSIAIHADAAENRNASGATIYALSQSGATSEQARLVADKENAADLIGGVGSVTLHDKDPVLTSVLVDLSMTASVATSLEVGDHLINALDEVTRMRRRNVEQAAFVELKSAGIPSLLVETGYITNREDAENLDSPAWRKRFAKALVNGITTWFTQRPPRGSLIAWQKEQGVETANPAVYTVQRGDSLSLLAARFGVSMASLKAENNLRNDTIQLGQKLKIPGAATVATSYKEHTIARGETLSQIAVSYSVTLDVIREANQLKSDTIRPGQVLKIPTS